MYVYTLICKIDETQSGFISKKTLLGNREFTDPYVGLPLKMAN